VGLARLARWLLRHGGNISRAHRTGGRCVRSRGCVLHPLLIGRVPVARLRRPPAWPEFAAPPDSLQIGFDHLAEHRVALPPGSFLFVVSDFLGPSADAGWERALGFRWDIVPVVVQDPVWEQSFPDVGGVSIPYADPATGRVVPVRLSSDEAAHRIHFFSSPRILRLPDRSGAFTIQLVLAPYPTADRYLPHDAGIRGLPAAERRQTLAHAFRTRLSDAQRELDPTQPALLVAHAYVRTAETSNLFRMTEAEDIPIEPQDLPSWAYIALGHVHKAQTIGGRSSARYSGSIDRLDAGERNDEKSCLIVDIDRTGLVE